MKKKYWVVMVKYSGIQVEAEDEAEAEQIALDIDDEYYNKKAGEWEFMSAEVFEDD